MQNGLANRLLEQKNLNKIKALFEENTRHGMELEKHNTKAKNSIPPLEAVVVDAVETIAKLDSVCK